MKRRLGRLPYGGQTRLQGEGFGVRVAAADYEIVNPEAAHRAEWYQNKRWKAIRREHLRADPDCVKCGKRANQCDHLCGHDDEAALWVMRFLRIEHITPRDWRIRFWSGPFISLCHGCHSRKTYEEQRGRLFNWVERWQGS